MVKQIGFLLLAASIAALTPLAWAQKAEKINVTGYLIDSMCASQHLEDADPTVFAKSHTRACALKCADSGYGVLTTNEYYEFDEEGNKLAKALLEASRKKKGVMVVVEGTLEDDVLKVMSLKEK
jgi:hypothetical protein